MARTSSADEPILAAAINAFLTSGYDGVSVEAVAQLAGVARRTVFRRFDGKEAMFRAAVGHLWTRMPIEEIAHDRQTLEDPRWGLTRMGRTIADFWADPLSVAFVKMVICESHRFPFLGETYNQQGKLLAFAAFHDYIEELMRLGRISVPDPDLAARQFVGLVCEPLLWYRVLGHELDVSEERRQAVVDSAVGMFLGFYPLT